MFCHGKYFILIIFFFFFFLLYCHSPYVPISQLRTGDSGGDISSETRYPRTAKRLAYRTFQERRKCPYGGRSTRKSKADKVAPWPIGVESLVPFRGGTKLARAPGVIVGTMPRPRNLVAAVISARDALRGIRQRDKRVISS